MLVINIDIDSCFKNDNEKIGFQLRLLNEEAVSLDCNLNGCRRYERGNVEKEKYRLGSPYNTAVAFALSTQPTRVRFFEFPKFF